MTEKEEFLSQFESLEEYLKWWRQNLDEPTSPPHSVGSFNHLESNEGTITKKDGL